MADVDEGLAMVETCGQERGVIRDAVLSTCGTYRYSLIRQFFSSLGTWPESKVCWVMLNPSTADATIDDPTVRRCMNFTRKWRCNRMEIVNLYAFRATNPADLTKTADPIGGENDNWIRCAVADATKIVAAWGNGPNLTTPSPVKRFCQYEFPRRCEHVLDILRDYGPVYCLGTTQSGQPRHPVRLGKDVSSEVYRGLKRVCKCGFAIPHCRCVRGGR